MKRELQDKLIDKYPSLFTAIDSKPPLPIIFGLEVGDGWYNLLDELFSKIIELDPEVQLTQVKEKFGELRVYIMCGSDEVFELIDDYTEKSHRICEQCGEEGKLRGEGWLYTMCDKCYSKHLGDYNG